MNKAEFVKVLSDKTEFDQKSCEKVLKAALETITETVADGESIQFVGFGTFTSSERAKREAKNPRTGEKIVVPASRRPKFKPGKAFIEECNK